MRAEYIMERNSIEYLQGECTGCGACVGMCPVNAIRIARNNDGFYQAVVDKAICISCGKCTRVCVRAGYKKTSDIRGGVLYAMQSIDSTVVKACTSGGIGYELARKAYNQGKKVIGTVYDYELNLAKIIIAQDKRDIDRMRGSKYIQSNPTNVFRDIAEAAKKNPNQEFVFFGTPCQIYGMDRLAKEKGFRERMLLIDLFCHGVPSGLVWDSFLRTTLEKTGSSNWENICFRDSTVGWHDYVLKMENESRTICEDSEKSIFYRAFFDNVLLSKACFSCKARCYGSGSDIRLGDFWGKRYAKREDGVSAVLCLTPKGQNAVADSRIIALSDELPINECLDYQSVGIYSEESLYSDAIKQLRETGDLKKTVRTYRKKFTIKRKIKIQIKELMGHLPKEIKKKMKTLYRMR